jgi:hypothetical protein
MSNKHIIGHDVDLSGNIKITNTDDIMDTSGGAIVIDGGVSIAKQLDVTSSISSGTLTANTITDGIATLSSGALTANTITTSDFIEGKDIIATNSITDGTATLSSGALTANTITTSDFIEGKDIIATNSITDGIATLSSGSLTGATWNGNIISSSKLPIGTDIQAYNSNLSDIASLDHTNGDFIVSDGTNFTIESGTTAKTSLGLGNVEDTALSTWTGTSNITTVGTIDSGNISSNFGNINIGSSTIMSGDITSSGIVTGNSITDGTATLSSGTLTADTITADTITDGTATLSSGILTNFTKLYSDNDSVENFTNYGDFIFKQSGYASSNALTIQASGSDHTLRLMVDSNDSNKRHILGGSSGGADIYINSYSESSGTVHVGGDLQVTSTTNSNTYSGAKAFTCSGGGKFTEDLFIQDSKSLIIGDGTDNTDQRFRLHHYNQDSYLDYGTRDLYIRNGSNNINDTVIKLTGNSSIEFNRNVNINNSDLNISSGTLTANTITDGTASLSSGTFSVPSEWTLKGDNINGEAAGDRSGLSVSLSDDGSIIAIGAPYNDGIGSSAGHVRIYEWNSGTSLWDQKGSDIDGGIASDNNGYSVSLSSDGLIVAIGAIGYNANSGQVKIYEWNSGTSSWDQKGSDIDGEAASDKSGYSVSLSSDGLIVAIGATQNDDGGSDAGHVRIYEWNSGTSSWNQKGSDIDGETASEKSGHSVSLSSDGLIVAIGAIGYNADSGQVKIYEWNSGTSSWNQKGSDIDGEAASDQSGYSVSLSSDGSIIAIGAIGYNADSGQVKIYEWNSGTSSWDQKGSDIDGEAASDKSGYSVSLSSDGLIVAIGAIQNDDGGSNSGHVRIYEWNSGTNSWNQKGSDIDGENVGDGNGYSLSLSSDGSIIAIGAPYNDGIGSSAGHVRVYNFDNTIISNTISTPSTISGGTMIIQNSKTPPASNAVGTKGTIVWDEDYIYICTNTNTWKRSSISTW